MAKIRRLQRDEIDSFQTFEKICTPEAMCVASFIIPYSYNVYIAIENEQWIGYLIVHELDCGVWDLIHIAVLTEFQNRKVATTLMNYFEKSVYIKNITLEVDEANEKACHFYHKHGFQVQTIRKNYYGMRDGLLMNKEMKYILAIETSCDETAAAVVRSDFQILSNIIHTQVIHEQYGGVVPEVASREHVEKLPQIIQQAMDKAQISFEQLDYIAVTHGPGLAGSLMIGVEAAKTLGWQLNIPVLPINHMAGHIYANYAEGELQFPLLAITISGGHTEIVEMETCERFHIISQTYDDAIGEAYDKVARVLGLGYPGGPKVSALAKNGVLDHEFPIARVREDPYGMSFSGLKTAVINYVHTKKQKGEIIQPENIAHAFQHAVIQTLDEKITMCLNNKQYKQIVLAGGVSANQEIRKHVKDLAKVRGIHFTVPESSLCTDNAAMIGLAACAQLKMKQSDTFEINKKIKIEPGLVLQ